WEAGGDLPQHALALVGSRDQTRGPFKKVVEEALAAELDLAADGELLEDADLPELASDGGADLLNGRFIELQGNASVPQSQQRYRHRRAIPSHLRTRRPSPSRARWAISAHENALQSRSNSISLHRTRPSATVPRRRCVLPWKVPRYPRGRTPRLPRTCSR